MQESHLGPEASRHKHRGSGIGVSRQDSSQVAGLDCNADENRAIGWYSVGRRVQPELFP